MNRVYTEEISMNIMSYIFELNKNKVVITGNANIKSAIIEYLKAENINYICTMDDSFQYTIQLI